MEFYEFHQNTRTAVLVFLVGGLQLATFGEECVGRKQNKQASSQASKQARPSGRRGEVAENNCVVQFNCDCIDLEFNPYRYSASTDICLKPGINESNQF